MPKRKNKKNTKRIALLGIFTAIILIQNFVPFLGNIPIPPLNPTIIHITVIVATLVIGTKDGVIIGGIWGIVRMIRAYTVPSSPLDLLLWTNPVIAFIPRVLIGLVTGVVYQLLKRRNQKNQTFAMAAASVGGSLTNTLLVLTFIYLFYGAEYAAALDVDISNLMLVLAGVVATNGVAEAVVAAIVAPLVSKPLLKIKGKSK
ncbi:ECF transporter S component [Atopococcus tabaci]|uniref:ECF transporter S component n=1 Tax=Atopococcus tabaci TaxID=269774 RepID=UPI00240A8661|nr:ECF transporter S component [Atopococcus tabaci]